MSKKFSISRFLLVLLSIACLVLIIWIGYKLFLQHNISPLAGSILFIAGIGIFIWDIVTLRNKRFSMKNPSFAQVFFPILVIFLILAFAGVQPISTYKDKALTNVVNVFKSNSSLETSKPSPSATYTPIVQSPIPITSASQPEPRLSPTTSETTTKPSESQSKSQPVLTITDIVKDQKTEDIAAGRVTQCKVSIYLEPSSSAEPGYYTFELFSIWNNYGKQEFKYLRGDNIKPISWLISGGDTWLAMGKDSNLRNIFQTRYTYSPFELLTPVFTGTTPTTIENEVFELINSYRVKTSVAPLKWNQSIQDDSRKKAIMMLKEGKLSYLKLDSPYVGQMFFSSKVYQGQTPNEIARKPYDSWLGDQNQRQIMQKVEFTSMAVGYVVESRENIYYIEVLFSDK
jgi:hypothetical protein